MRLLLFDIDGTLLSAGRQVRPIFERALLEVYGETGDLERYDFGGKTDPQIVFDLLGGAGWERPAIAARLPQLQEAYLGPLERELRAEGMRLLPGVTALLERLAADSDRTVALLTGNWERGGRAKLARLGLDGYFPFGAFGDDGERRADLVPAALERARRHAGRSFAVDETVIIGDTVHDVACARAHGVPCLAVATGFTPEAALAAAGATWVVPDLVAALPLLDAG
jgi:phosphoglycolate phosphatase